MTTVGSVGIGNNLVGNAWAFGGFPTSDTAMMRMPNVWGSELTYPDSNGRVLLGQFTTEGSITNIQLNLKGFALNISGESALWDKTENDFLLITADDIPGCTDAGYDNYNANATVDDGSCITCTTYGCTDPSFGNYDVYANCDNGTCA